MEQSKETKRTVCQTFSRVNGWYTPITQWNKGKVAEWNDRVEYEPK
jgi:anaerobic ribonucleoside-triphosphate reductase